MRKVVICGVISFVVGLIILPLGALIYLRFGYAPVATAAPPLPLERWLASSALKARIRMGAPKQSPIPASEDNLLAGAKVYRQYCAVCHGMRGRPKTATAKGMYPPPPQLFHGEGVTDDPVGVTYWKVANGIRLTGMPAYSESVSNTQLWQVSQLLANADHLPPAVANFLASESPAQ